MKTTVFLVAVALSVLIAAAEERTVLVQVAHRHGARTAIASSNQSIICGSRGCGMLTDEGKDMLVHAGKWLRETYPSLLANTENYDPNFAYTRSTMVDRTIQSADGLLRGLFPNISAFYPVVDMVNFYSDTLLLIDGMPGFIIPYELQNAKFMKDLEAYVLDEKQSGLGREVLEEIGDELSLVKTCRSTKAGDLAQCALTTQDIATVRNAEGTLSKYPVTESKVPELNKVLVVYRSMYALWNASKPDDKAAGSAGYNLASLMAKNMNDTRAKKNSYGFFEYSAHDSTMVPLCVALGHPELLLPLFGQMLALETFFTTEAPDTWRVRARYGQPGQTPANHSYTMTYLSLNCIHPNGTHYTTTESADSCPIDDFWRFVNTSAPASAEGMCYLSPAVRSQIGCDSRDAPTQTLCLRYRELCPAYACPSGWFVNPTDGSCNVKKTAKEDSLPLVASLASFGGIVFGLCASVFYKRVLRRRGAQPGQLLAE